MAKDLFIIDTMCELNASITAAFQNKGYEVKLVTDCEGIPDTVLEQAAGFKALCLFVNKKISDDQVKILKSNGIQLVLCCSVGYDNVPIALCKANEIRVARVPSYSPSSIAEYAISSMLTLAKQIQLSYVQCRAANFTISGLRCILMEDKTVGVIGTGLIGRKCVLKLSGMVSKILCYDKFQNDEWIKTVPNAEYVTMDDLLANSHIVSVHTPLLPETRHMINKETIGKMREGVILVNTSRGEIVNTTDLLEGLKSKKIFGCALDVFEGEKALIFQDVSKVGLDELPELKELCQLPNVIISSHVAFYTDESIRQITEKTLQNFEDFVGGVELDEKTFVT